MPLLPPSLPGLCPCSCVSCLPLLAVVLPLVLHHLSFLSRHRLPSGGTSTCPPLVTLLPLVLPLLFSGMVSSCLHRLFVASPLVTLLPPPIRLRLRLSLHRRLSLRPSHAICQDGCCIASHHADASHPPTPPTLVLPLPLVAPLSCLLSTLAGCRVDPTDHPQAHHMPHISPTYLPSWKPSNVMQIHGILSSYSWM